MWDETETRLPEEGVRRYFPSDLAQRLSIEEAQLGFHGTMTDRRRTEGTGVSRELYLIALGKGLPPELRALSFEYSDKRLIQEEGDLIRYGGNEELRENTPLLLLRLYSGIHVPENAFKVMELLRYADHDALRNRGIATALVETLRERLREDGTEYLHVLPAGCVWPRSAHPIGYNNLPADVREDISSCFADPEPGILWEDSLFYMTDRARHDALATSQSRQELPCPSLP